MESKVLQQELAYLHRVSEALDISVYVFKSEDVDVVNELINSRERFSEWASEILEKSEIWGLFLDSAYPLTTFTCKTREEAVSDLLACGFGKEMEKFLRKLTPEELESYKKVAEARITTYLEVFMAERCSS